MNWMACDVEFTDEFGDWWDHLAAEEQASVRAYTNMRYLLLKAQRMAVTNTEYVAFQKTRKAA